MKAQYPQDVYDLGREFTNQIGTFWSSIFTDADKLNVMFDGYFAEAGQTYRRFMEYLATASRLDCPVFSKEYWHYLVIKESELNTDTLRYGSGGVYGDNNHYGVRTNTLRHAAKVPDKFVSAEFIFNKIVNPEVTWNLGLDYTITNGEIIFNDSPFDTSSIPVNDIYDAGGNVIDREVGLWLYNSEFDLEYIWQHYGYSLGVFMKSSTFYKDFINAIADAFIVGPSLGSIEGLLQAMTGIPLVKEKEEIVEEFIETTSRPQVITNLNVYTFNPGVNIIVNKGDTVYAGDALTDSLQLFELFEYIPNQSELPALVLGRDFCTGDYANELVLENKEVPLEYVGQDDDGRVIVKFEISGRDEDVDAFWNNVHERGKVSGKVFSEYLDTREDKTYPPTAASLPSVINPMVFALQELMANNLFIIRMKVNDFAAGTPGIGWFKALRRIMAPQTTYIVYVEFSPEDVYINLDDSEEIIELFETNTVDTELTESIMFESVLLREVEEC